LATQVLNTMNQFSTIATRHLIRKTIHLKYTESGANKQTDVNFNVITSKLCHVYKQGS